MPRNPKRSSSLWAGLLLCRRRWPSPLFDMSAAERMQLEGETAHVCMTCIIVCTCCLPPFLLLEIGVLSASSRAYFPGRRAHQKTGPTSKIFKRLGEIQGIVCALVKVSLGTILIKSEFNSYLKAHPCSPHHRLASLSTQKCLPSGFRDMEHSKTLQFQALPSPLPWSQLWQWRPQSSRSRHWPPSTGKPRGSKTHGSTGIGLFSNNPDAEQQARDSANSCEESACSHSTPAQQHAPCKQ